MEKFRFELKWSLVNTQITIAAFKCGRGGDEVMWREAVPVETSPPNNQTINMEHI